MNDIKNRVKNEYKNYFIRTERRTDVGDGDYINYNTTSNQYSSASNASTESADTEQSKVNSLETYSVLNMPHQFLSTADVNLDTSTDTFLGRTYKEHIAANAPVVIFKVGKPDYSAGDKKDADLLEGLMELDIEMMQDKLDEMFRGVKSNQMYYYTFKDDFDNYCKYVNQLVRYTASRMGLEFKYRTYNLKEDKKLSGNNRNFLKIFATESLKLSNFLAFYADASGTSASESGSNSTTDSQLASGLKTLGQSKRELDFLFGAPTGNKGDTTFGDYSNKIAQTYSKFSGGVEKIMGKISGTFTSVSSGANVIFPQIWSDSEFTTSVSIQINLDSPYGDKESVFRNVYIPFYCLLAMALPRMSGKQGYVGPFLVQVASKGWFSINCGMVGSIDVKKGGSSGQDWNVDNMPTSIQVTMQIKDVYPTIVATASTYAFGQSIGLCDYLKVMAGVVITDFDPAANLQATVDWLLGTITDIPSNIYTSFASTLGAPVRGVINKIFGGYN